MPAASHTPTSTLSDAKLDVLVVGAGITGACIALDAARRGLRTALIDRGDFASGATANCLRIVHGGLRYLQHLDLRRSRQSSIERSVWLRSAPHLVEPLPVVVPTMRGAFPPRWLLTAALAANDAISADRNEGVEQGRHIPRARVLSREECTALIPALDHANLTGGVLFHDAIMYSPERLTLEVVQAARDAGALTGNHVEFVAAQLASGRVVGCRLRDTLTGAVVEAGTRWIINAAGAAVGNVARRLSGEPFSGEPAFSVALNLVTREPASGPAFAVSGGAVDPDRVLPAGARQLFAVPWRGQRLLGTAHFPFRGDPSNAVLPHDLVHLFLQELRSATPQLNVGVEDVCHVQWGLLPLADSSAADRVRLLKRHRIIDHSRHGLAGALSVVSVKFTTARHLAAQVVDRIAGRRTPEPRPTEIPLPGKLPEDVQSAIATARMKFSQLLPGAVLEHLVRSYGARYESVVALAQSIEGGADLVRRDAPVIVAQLMYGVRQEQARTVEDLLWRRCELGARGLITEGARSLAQRVLELTHAGKGSAVIRAD